MTALRIDVRFVCPECKGHMFSSSNCTSRGNMIRHCTSIRRIDGVRCKVEFHERDDWKYFVITVPGIRRFKNRDEYELVMDIIRAQMGPAIGMGVRA